VQTEHSANETGSFGLSLFDDPSTRALSRVGVVDVGSNSVRMVVFDGAARSPAYFYNEKIMCALGAGVSETGQLSPSGRKRALAAMIRFKHLADGMGLSELTVVATAAVRDANDGPDFCADVLRDTGLKIWVIDGKEEARLSAQGVLLGWPGAYGLICDIGGSSMELAEISEGRVGKRVTSNLGPLKLQSIKGGHKGRKAHIKSAIAELVDQMGAQRDRLFLVGGSWRAIARIDMHRRAYPLHVLHEYRMTPAHVSATAKYGIREGMLFEQMPQRLRDRDPLIEASRFAEAKDARMPGFGKSLYDFVLPLFKSSPDARKRLVKAACLLHDVSWRAHPDYRAEICFDNATRANLGGLNHSERVFLGISLLHRYSNSREGTRFEELYSLIDDKTKLEAEVLGKAMRFGAMLWMEKGAERATFKWFPKKRLLELRLTRDALPLYGEVAEVRLQSLASSLDAELCVKVRKD